MIDQTPLRYALNAVAEVAPTWLKSLAPTEWYDRYSKRFEDTRLPRTASEREVLAQTIGADGFYLLDNIYQMRLGRLLVLPLNVWV